MMPTLVRVSLSFIGAAFIMMMIGMVMMPSTFASQRKWDNHNAGNNFAVLLAAVAVGIGLLCVQLIFFME